MESKTIVEQLHAAFDAAGVEGYLHCVDIDGGGEVRYASDRLNHLASMGKVPILVALMRSIAAGEHTLEERVRVPAGERTLGPTGLSVMKHEADLSLRDVAHLMIVVSDNHATDVVLGMVPPERVTATMRDMGLETITIEMTIAEMFARMRFRRDSVTDQNEMVARMRSDPYLQGETAPWRGTAEDMTTLLGSIWRDEAAPPELCAEMREILYAQYAPHRLSTGFPDDVKIGGKTGTLAGIRNECGVLEYPDGKRYAVAVFTRTENYAFRNPPADRVIGTTARLAVDHIRGDVPADGRTE